MSLRLQLLAFGALTLALPWAGLKLVQQIEGVLRTSLEDSLKVSATALAASDELVALAPTFAPADAPIYAHALRSQPAVDGFRADWHFARAAADEAALPRALELGEGVRVFAGIGGLWLYLFFEIADDEIVYQSPGAGVNGDRIALVYENAARELAALIVATAAPAESLFAERARLRIFDSVGAEETRVQAAWRERDGYAVELRMPLSMLATETLGVAVIDVDPVFTEAGSGAGGYSVKLLSTWDAEPAAQPLVHERRELADIVERYAALGVGDRWRIVGADGWVLADSGALDDVPIAIEPDDMPLAERFFRFVLRRDDPGYSTLESPPGRIGDPALRRALAGEPATAWYRQGGEVNAVVAAAVGIPGSRGAAGEPAWQGAVLLEQTSDSVLTATSTAMMRVMTTTLVASVVAAVGLLGYASLLSFRVGRLARAAESALGPRGEINARLPGTRAGDEIGALSRSFEGLLGRLRDYTDYLKSLKSKLSHELRTPLAIVSTSLDNLEHEPASESVKAYHARLRHGTARLESILQAMTAATRVEQAITQTETERFDLTAVVAACVGAYEGVYPGQSFRVSLPSEAVVVEGSADLIAQLLDKLVDNAAGFAVPGTAIEIDLTAHDRDVSLSVTNKGPSLPEAMRHQLFDSLVSVRDAKGDKPHLGLGLYIVALIVEFHGGRVEASNLADSSGVAIVVRLPRRDARAA